MTKDQAISKMENLNGLTRSEIKEVYDYLKVNHLDFYKTILDRQNISDTIKVSLDYLRGLRDE